MKTQDFMDALGGINEKYLKDLLEEPSESAAGGLISVSEDSGQKAVAAPEPERGAKPIVSGIFRYLVFAASAAACIGGIALLVKLGNQKINMTSGDSQPVPVTEITDITSQTTASAVTFTGTEQTTLTDTTSDVLSETNTVTELTEETTTDSAESSAETVTELTTETTTEFVTDTERMQTETTAEQTVKTSAENSTTTVTSITETSVSEQTEKTRIKDYDESIQFGDEYNKVIVKCVDLNTKKPLEGVEISLIELPNFAPKKVASWVSDSTGVHQFDGLTQIGEYLDDPAYMVRVDKLPDEYTGGYDQVIIWDSAYDHIETINYYFIRTSEDVTRNLSINIYDEESGALLNDITTYDLWLLDRDNFPSQLVSIYEKATPGKQTIVPDGIYVAYIDVVAAAQKGYYTKENLEMGYESGLFATSIDFTVTDGKPDKDPNFYLVKGPILDSKQNTIAENDE